jgi:hypothetical protein
MQIYVVQYTAPGNERSVIAGAAESFEAAVRLAQSVIPSDTTLLEFKPFKIDDSGIPVRWSADAEEIDQTWKWLDMAVIVKADVVQDQEGN